jgi:hypothetical protein
LNNEKKNILSEKRRQLQLKLNAQELVERKIVYHWLEVFEAIKQSGINYQIEYLCIVSEEIHPYVLQAVEDLNNPEFNEGLVRKDSETEMDAFFRKYPSIEPLKYIPDLPVLTDSDNLNFVFEQANEQIGFGNESVYFLSPDWWPVLKLNWQDIKQQGAEIFANTPLPFLFTDKSHQKILFKSLEDEWRITKSFEKT